MASARGAEQPGAVVLGVRTALQAELPVTTQPEDMNRSMEQAAPMNLPAELPSDDGIPLVDDIKHLIRRLADFALAHRPRSMMTFHRLVSSRSCFFQSGSHAAN